MRHYFAIAIVVCLAGVLIFWAGRQVDERFLRGVLTPKFKLAVVGGGLGGASVSAYTAKYFKDVGCGRTASFDIFEKTDRFGGRLLSYDFKGASYNPMQLGGNWFPNTSLTILQLLNELGIKIVEAEYDNVATRIWNGSKFENPNPPTNPTDCRPDVANKLSGTDPNWCRLYKAHNFFNFQIGSIYLFLAFNQIIFTSVWGFLNPYGVEGFGGAPFPFTNYQQFLQQPEYQISEEFLNHIVIPNLRFIWSQSSEINAFSGFIGDVLVDNHFRIEGGSTNLVTVLLDKVKKHSNQYLNTKVTDITLLPDGKYEVKSQTTQNGKVQENSGIYDGVALTSPVEFADIKFHGVDFPNRPARSWLSLHMYLVDAKEMNPAYFGLSDDAKVPDSIKTTNGEADFTSIFPTSPTDHGTKVYMIFAYNELDIERLFNGIVPFNETVKWIHHFYPYVYQKLTPKASLNDFRPYEVAPNFIYLNAMEDFVSGMELCLISSNNAGKYFADRNARPPLLQSMQ